ncbi:stage V sporulation protein AD [Clostridium sp. YIM B02505]|uniref:Stage V sporulation protein AD n=1 Tax=Clostridium yunnanense TaxID=2800325 RepID=A0ABS1ESN4_9CLOT|nr:stage V sporulation protein AD [Clostridium yunnanense]MBK1812357.1 stage V sporulation protein AD [Clostridium yunnanense]
MLKGRQTWIFESKPVIISSAAVVGPFEGKGALAEDFDVIHEDVWMGADTVERAEKRLLEEACNVAIEKAGMKKEDIQFFISGDLMNQIISSSFTARSLDMPFFGVFGACSSSMEGLALASLIVDSKAAQYVLAGASSHNIAVEKQFRYPTEYGAQKPPTAQWTVTGAGVGLIAQQGEGPKVTSATIGKVVDMGIGDPYNMGAAMAPAAADTIENHFKNLNIEPSYYDLIATGDLGRVGHELVIELLKKKGIEMPKDKFMDCGLMIYKDDQPVMAGGSGCGCSATVTYAHLLKRMKKGELKKILIIATGALLSPISYQQGETIPCIAHAVSIEM